MEPSFRAIPRIAEANVFPTDRGAFAGRSVEILFEEEPSVLDHNNAVDVFVGLVVDFSFQLVDITLSARVAAHLPPANLCLRV
jgi:hypothetical protein